MTNVFKGKTFLLVTGASRGIGKHIAQTLSARLENKSHVLLLARDVENLKKTADNISKNLVVSYKSVDFSDTSVDALREIIEESKNAEPENFSKAIIVHSAGMASFSQLTTEMIDFDEWRKCFNVNTFSPAVLNGVFMKAFHNKNIEKYVINITSYWSSKPEAYVGSYCTATAAKNMFFKVFTLEYPDVKVLNYLPGIVETDMLYAALKMTKSEQLKSSLEKIIEEKKFVTPEDTSKCLVDVFEKQKYQSGDYVDYCHENSIECNFNE